MGSPSLSTLRLGIDPLLEREGGLGRAARAIACAAAAPAMVVMHGMRAVSAASRIR